eukprot:4788362-Prymnesium_polylepis.1
MPVSPAAAPHDHRSEHRGHNADALSAPADRRTHMGSLAPFTPAYHTRTISLCVDRSQPAAPPQPPSQMPTHCYALSLPNPPTHASHSLASLPRRLSLSLSKVGVVSPAKPLHPRRHNIWCPRASGGAKHVCPALVCEASANIY